MEKLATALSGFAPALASALLHSLWQVAVLAAAAALALRGLARARAAWRHNVAMAFLVAIALAPAAQFLRFWQQGGDSDGLLALLTTPLLGTAADGLVRNSTRLAAVVAMLWLLGAGLMLARHVAGLRAIAAAERGEHQLLPEHWRRRVDALREAMGIARDVAVRLSDDVLTPWTARLVRPVIWLPLSLLARAPAEQIEALLAHELAHIARKDWLWNGVQCAIESLLFYHPGMWWLGRRIRQEREHACDDLAVAACGDPIALAEALAALERHRWSAAHTSTRLVLAANGGSLMQRVTRLLSGPPSRRKWGALIGLGALTVSGVLALTQIGMAGGQFPDLMVRASTDGPLGPGDYREISANDRQRFYRGSKDAQGRLTETYSEAGQAKPIDAGVRGWIEQVSQPPVIPTAPEYPRIEDMADFKALIAAIGASPDVAARLGAPVTMTSKQAGGNVQLQDAEGHADIRVELSGPRGIATVAAVADMSGHKWTLRSVAVQ